MHNTFQVFITKHTNNIPEENTEKKISWIKFKTQKSSISRKQFNLMILTEVNIDIYLDIKKYIEFTTLKNLQTTNSLLFNYSVFKEY